MPRNIMVDLETLGTVPGCVILSIGAVEFSQAGLSGLQHYDEISTSSCTDAFLSISQSTKDWWSQREEAARSLLNRCASGGTDIRSALEGFASFVKTFGDDVCVWGNGADFDNAILAVAYDILGIPMPWKFWNNRCYRSLKALHPDIKLERVGTYHNALDDARSQAEHAVRLLQRQDEVCNLWGEMQDDSLGEGGREAVQSPAAPRGTDTVHKADAAGDRLPRQNVSVGLPTSSVR